MIWWALYLLPGLLLAGFSWEMLVNGWLPDETDPYMKRQIGVFAEVIRADPKHRLALAFLLFALAFGWPAVFLLPTGRDS